VATEHEVRGSEETGPAAPAVESASATNDVATAGGALLRQAAGGASAPGGLGSLDPGARARAVLQLQRTAGNACVQRLAAQWRAASAPRPGVLAQVPLLQRYPVPFKSTADCEDVVNWINTSGPYSQVSGAAQTRTPLRYKFGKPKIVGTAPDFTVSVPAMTVTYERKPPDMPQWNPKDPETKKAWNAGMADLRAHEGEHVKKGELYERLTQDQMRMITVEVTAQDEREAWTKAKPEFEDAFQKWIDDLQKSHDAIDPYTANITCPPKKTP
jgi:predicted secreted Zn-dependent protease